MRVKCGELVRMRRTAATLLALLLAAAAGAPTLAQEPAPVSKEASLPSCSACSPVYGTATGSWAAAVEHVLLKRSPFYLFCFP